MLVFSQKDTCFSPITEKLYFIRLTVSVFYNYYSNFFLVLEVNQYPFILVAIFFLKIVHKPIEVPIRFFFEFRFSYLSKDKEIIDQAKRDYC